MVQIVFDKNCVPHCVASVGYAFTRTNKHTLCWCIAIYSWMAHSIIALCPSGWETWCSTNQPNILN